MQPLSAGALRISTLTFITLVASACTPTPPPQFSPSESPATTPPPPVDNAELIYPIDKAPAHLQTAVDAGNQAIASLKMALQAELTAEMTKGGPAGAVRVCRDVAPLVNQEITTTEVAVGRTSARLRNPHNTPRPWLTTMVESLESAESKDAEALVFDLGETVGIAKPISTVGVCLNCHGSEERVTPQIQSFLREHYPNDAATGYTVGKLRGWFWAEVHKEVQKAP